MFVGQRIKEQIFYKTNSDGLDFRRICHTLIFFLLKDAVIFFITCCFAEQVPVAEVQAFGASSDHRGAASQGQQPRNHARSRSSGHVSQQTVQRGGMFGRVSSALEQGELGGK